MLNSSDSESRTDSDNEDDINQLDSSGDVSNQSSSDQDVCIKGNCNLYIYISIHLKHTFFYFGTYLSPLFLEMDKVWIF